MQLTQLLAEKEVQQVHEASLEILENIGLLVNNAKARSIYADHGCRLASGSMVVKFPRSIVEEYRRHFVPTFTFRGRDPQFDITVPDDRPVIVTGSSAPNIIDPHTGEERRATSKDIADIAFLINELPGFDMFSISTLADDAPTGQFSLSRFYPALKNCLKPVRSNTTTKEDLHQVLELGTIVAGGKEAYRERPIINHHCCPSVSPLTLDVDSTDTIITLTELGLPAIFSIVPNAGMTAPMTLLGTLTLGNAEFLALSTLIQMIRPESPMVYGVLSTVADMRTGNYTPGAIETGILQMGHSQMANFYDVPSGGYIGLTNSQVNDAQAGYETGMNTTAALLAGSDMFNMGGLVGGLMAFDFAKAVIDSEIGLMLKQLRRGIPFSKDQFALDVISEVGPGGSYMDQVHTVENMRTTGFLADLAMRDLRSLWVQKGRPDSHTVALAEARRILTRGNPAVFDADVDARIRSRFEGMVPGKAGWR